MLTLDHGALSLHVELQPLRFTLRRDGRRLLRNATVWAVDGTVEDRFIALTEGVVTGERRGFPEGAGAAAVLAASSSHAVLDVGLTGGRRATVSLGLGGDALVVEFAAERDPLRIGAEWDLRTGEQLAGLGARHDWRVDHAGRDVQLGADRRYTGPDCPRDLLALGGVPQGDYAPAPWFNSSRGYGVWVETSANGTRFDLEDGIAVSVRSHSGPLRVHVLCDPTPAARLRHYGRLTGMPALLPEWGYGFWKSRDVYEHQDDVLEDFRGFREHGVPLDAIVLDSPWETQYNTWIPNPHQFPDFAGLVRGMREDGVRTVVWITPWVNRVSDQDSQIPPQPQSRRLHAEPASNYAEGAREGHLMPFVARWWMGEGSPVDFASPAAEAWWREQAKRVLELGVTGIKADDGEGYYLPEHAEPWAYGERYRRSMQRALDEVHPGDGVVFGRCGWAGAQSVGHLWAGDQLSDFWSLRTLVAATISAASSGFSNWSHDVGGYLGYRLIDRAPAELLVRWAQLGCFTPLMQAHARMKQEPWRYRNKVLGLYRGYVLLHEQLVPYIRAAARTAATTGLPIVRPLPLVDPGDPRGWSVADAFGFGPALWVAPVIDAGAREREVVLPRGRWIETWSGERVEGGREVIAPAPLDRIPVWVREGSLIPTYPAEHVARGLGDTAEAARPLDVTLWGDPPLGRAATRLADGTKLSWRRGRGLDAGGRAVRFVQR